MCDLLHPRGVPPSRGDRPFEPAAEDLAVETASQHRNAHVSPCVRQLLRNSLASRLLPARRRTQATHVSSHTASIAT
jgi:hypothetical protein